MRLKKVLFSRITVLTVGCVLGLAGCTTRDEPLQKVPTVSPPPKTVRPTVPPRIIKQQKVALLVPLSGRHADVGKSLQQAAELSLFEHADHHLELLIKDTRGTAEGARDAATSALHDGAEVILGPLFAHEVTAVSMVTQGHIPVLAFSNNRAVARRGIFTLGYAPADQIARLVHYAIGQGIQNIALFTPQDEYGRLVAEVFQNLHSRGLIHLVQHISYQPGHLSHLPPLTAQPIQGLFFAEGGNTVLNLLDALHAQGLPLTRFKLFGLSQWEQPQILNNPRLVGGLFVAGDPAARREFEHLYERAYHQKPAKIAAFAYDAVSLVTVLNKLDKQHPFRIDNFLHPQGFSGVEGIFRLREDGSVERGLAIHEITGYGSRIVDPAPKRF
jgi:ABC-type branched-subunit amino acid transport system substrate-binding protein